MKLSDFINNLHTLYESQGDCDIIFESNKHQYQNAKVVYHEEINEQGDKRNHVTLSCFGKVK